MELQTFMATAFGLLFCSDECILLQYSYVHFKQFVTIIVDLHNEQENLLDHNLLSHVSSKLKNQRPTSFTRYVHYCLVMYLT